MMGAWFQFLDQETFYLSLDSELLVDVISTDLSYLKVREGGREGGGREGEGKEGKEREGGEGRNTCTCIKTFFVY